MQLKRREFLTSTCKACLMAGAGFMISDLIACSPSSIVLKLPVSENTVRMPVSAFATKQIQIVRPDGWFYDIAVRKNSGVGYEALLLECTHQQNQLIINQNGFKCELHGSQFNLDGQVVKGPAERDLKRFVTHVDREQVVIQLKS
jgi:nitrite reductase/ring-hydroxylating ferredoxin subunit